MICQFIDERKEEHGVDVEDITSQWVHWYNTSRLMHRLGPKPPQAEYWAAADLTREPAR